MIIVFAVLCFVCAIGILFWGLGTANEFEYEAKKIEKWAKQELDHREAERKDGEAVDLDKIPSITQQILCRECKHYKQDSQGISYCYKHRGYGWDWDDFCSYAERREEGDE